MKRETFQLKTEALHFSVDRTHFENRTFQKNNNYVAIGHIESPIQTMTCGIPQGSRLGPLLFFLLYINDLPSCSETLTFRIFADDTNLFASARDLKSPQTLINSELGKVKVIP